MNKTRKLPIFLPITVMLVGMAIYGGTFIYRHIVEQRELGARMEAEREEQKRVEKEYRQIVEAYVRVNLSFYMGPDPAMTSTREVGYRLTGRYRPLPETSLERNRFGINHIRYSILRMYYHQAGVTLAYETMLEYFSQEFEPCGVLRLYNNGNHPEVEAFVNWMEGGRRHIEVSGYLHRLQVINFIYGNTHAEAGFVAQPFYELSPQMLDAIARADADPDYVLDLTSLQQQGY